jgi:DNA-binding transcriptional regulator YiaG
MQPAGAGEGGSTVQPQNFTDQPQSRAAKSCRKNHNQAKLQDVDLHVRLPFLWCMAFTQDNGTVLKLNSQEQVLKIIVFFSEAATMSSKRSKRKMWTPEKIKQLRELYQETQVQFADRLGVGLGTLRFWEQDKGRPTGSALKLLDRLEEDLQNGRIEQPA